jgi:hypothetical protein
VFREYMRIKDPFKNYVKNKTPKTLQELKKSEEYIKNFLQEVENKRLSYENIDVLLKKLIINSGTVLGYYLNPVSTFNHISEMINCFAPFAKEFNDIVNQKFIRSLKEELTYIITEENLYTSLKTTEIESATFHVIVSFKHAPMELAELRVFLEKLRNSSNALYVKVIFYMADDYFKDIPKINEDELLKLDDLISTLQEAKTLTHSIAQKNKVFRGIYKKYLATYTSLNDYMQKMVSPDVLNIMESTRDFADPIQFSIFLGQYTKDKYLKYEIIDATKKDKIRDILNKNYPNDVLFLNVKSFLQYYSKETSRYKYVTVTTLEDYKMEHYMEFLDYIAGQKENSKSVENSEKPKEPKVETEHFIKTLENESSFHDLNLQKPVSSIHEQTFNNNKDD